MLKSEIRVETHRTKKRNHLKTKNKSTKKQAKLFIKLK
ncbi:hypothetical Protein pso3_04350 [Candidatus Phytoplasma solani]